MEEIKVELDRILRSFLDSRKDCLINVAVDIGKILESQKAGEISYDMKDELLEDIAEFARVETTAELLETKLRVEQALDLLGRLLKFV